MGGFVPIVGAAIELIKCLGSGYGPQGKIEREGDNPRQQVALPAV
tara:strand:+ start:398 stop:532 length:135 start_codon:yes stop_codon:yes gene_type:complete